jgi:cytochrome c biogenesis protein CcmG, thiol:disulfide interchange protein DsbE
LSDGPLCHSVAVRKGAVILACLAVLAGCGSSNPPSAALSKQQLARAFAGSPAKLGRLHAQANLLLGGKQADFVARLAALRGLPVVVNKWASWCAPCRGEFPIFQRVVLHVGNKVAFLGLDAQDADSDARKFLERFPVTYPSYRDPDLKISTSIQAGIAFPTTIFFDRRGKLVYAHPGPYSKVADLLADIRRYTGA